jgi:hypothetical protein
VRDKYGYLRCADSFLACDLPISHVQVVAQIIIDVSGCERREPIKKPRSAYQRLPGHQGVSQATETERQCPWLGEEMTLDDFWSCQLGKKELAV